MCVCKCFEAFLFYWILSNKTLYSPVYLRHHDVKMCAHEKEIQSLLLDIYSTILESITLCERNGMRMNEEKKHSKMIYFFFCFAVFMNREQCVRWKWERLYLLKCILPTRMEQTAHKFKMFFTHHTSHTLTTTIQKKRNEHPYTWVSNSSRMWEIFRVHTRPMSESKCYDDYYHIWILNATHVPLNQIFKI